MSKTVTVPSEATLLWPPVKQAIWDTIVVNELNSGKYINAWELTDKIYSAVLSTAPAVEPEGGEVERVARAIDPGAWEDDGPIPTRKDTVTFHERRQRSAALARAAIAAMGRGETKVKPLEWEETLPGRYHWAGPYRIKDMGAEWQHERFLLTQAHERTGYHERLGEFDTFSDADKAANEFHQRRIRSALRETDHG